MRILSLTRCASLGQLVKLSSKGTFNASKLWFPVTRVMQLRNVASDASHGANKNAPNANVENTSTTTAEEKSFHLLVAHYEGGGIDGMFHGRGKLTYDDGASLEGEFKNGVIYNGKGVYISKSGDKYEGSWVNGDYYSTNGEKELFHGTGSRLLGDGSVYQGKLVHGNRHDHGRIVNEKEGTIEEVVYDHGNKVSSKLLPFSTNVSTWNTMNGTGILSLKDGSTYEGELQKGTMHGQGKITYPDGRSREGEFKDGKIWNGKGVFTLKSGDVYKGDLREGKHHGRGKLTHSDGRTLEGEFREGRLWTGKGVYTHKDGAVYEGEFAEGKMHGQGKLTYPGGRTLEGEFKEGRLWNGSGLYILKSGDIYEGEMREGKHHGQGKLTHPDGLVLEGEFVEGKFWNGVGALKLRNGAVYEGAFVGGKMHGQGKLTMAPLKESVPEGEVAKLAQETAGTMSVESGYVLEGEFRNNKLWKGLRRDSQGQVTLRFEAGQSVAETSAVPISFTNKQGAVFDGIYLNKNKKHGKGQITYPDGSVYEGEWLSRKRHGAGRLTSASGEVFEGLFEKDVPVSGKGVLPFKDGGKYEGELVEGKRHGLAKITNTKGEVKTVSFDMGKKVQTTALSASAKFNAVCMTMESDSSQLRSAQREGDIQAGPSEG